MSRSHAFAECNQCGAQTVQGGRYCVNCGHQHFATQGRCECDYCVITVALSALLNLEGREEKAAALVDQKLKERDKQLADYIERIGLLIDKRVKEMEVKIMTSLIAKGILP